MGKRELLIIAVFAVVGVALYGLVAPPAPANGPGFSLSRLTEAWRNRNVPPARATVTTAGVLPATAALGELRLAGLVTVNVLGENRDDVVWTLTVETNGQDEAAVRRAAESTTLRHDDLGDVLALSVRSVGDIRQSSTLDLKVPARLVVRVESARNTRIMGVAEVRLENLVGDTDVRRVAGLVSGAHRNGKLIVDDVGEVNLTLVSSEATILDVRGGTSLSVRNGETRVERGRGAMTVEMNSQALTVVEPFGDVRVSGVGGHVTLERPRAAVNVDARRTRVDLAIDRAFPATVFTTESEVSLTLAPGAPVALDIVSESGTIDAGAMSVPVDTVAQDQRLVHAFGNAARVAIRTQRSAVVITPGK
jgi:hypothetical protein